VIGSQSAFTARFVGAMPWRTSASPSSLPSTAPGHTPIADPTSPTIAASHAIMRRIWPGVAATARSSAISRSRCWIDSPIVPDTTNSAMNIASPPNEAATAISLVRASWRSGASALPRSPPVSTSVPGPAAASSREASKPGPASTPIASTRPGCPATRAASASVRKIAASPTGCRGRATPTTVTVRGASVEASRSFAPTRAR
jgi:hypothetical protein